MNDIYFYDASALLKLNYPINEPFLTSVNTIKKIENAADCGSRYALLCLDYLKSLNLLDINNDYICILPHESEIEDAQWFNNTLYPDCVVFATANLSTALEAQRYFGNDNIKLI